MPGAMCTISAACAPNTVNTQNFHGFTVDYRIFSSHRLPGNLAPAPSPLKNALGLLVRRATFASSVFALVFTVPELISGEMVFNVRLDVLTQKRK